MKNIILLGMVTKVGTYFMVLSHVESQGMWMSKKFKYKAAAVRSAQRYIQSINNARIESRRAIFQWP